jgi:protein-S-isoprenylcysteine O-methyltransferase Ste14
MKKLIPPKYLFISLAIILLSYFIAGELIPFPYNFAGLIVFTAGFVLMGVTNKLFKRYNTPNTFAKSSAIIQEGPFKFSRNPMYLGMFLFLLGPGIWAGNIISLTVPFIFLAIIHFVFVPFEEKKMEDTFGESYLLYKRKTHKWI